jgi:hypothetical protein
MGSSQFLIYLFLFGGGWGSSGGLFFLMSREKDRLFGFVISCRIPVSYLIENKHILIFQIELLDVDDPPPSPRKQ